MYDERRVLQEPGIIHTYVYRTYYKYRENRSRKKYGDRCDGPGVTAKAVPRQTRPDPTLVSQKVANTGAMMRAC